MNELEYAGKKINYHLTTDAFDKVRTVIGFKARGFPFYVSSDVYEIILEKGHIDPSHDGSYQNEENWLLVFTDKDGSYYEVSYLGDISEDIDEIKRIVRWMKKIQHRNEHVSKGQLLKELKDLQ